jgi:hypothetical protein
MAQWEVTIRAHLLVVDDEGDECQFTEQHIFIWTGPDLIAAMMSVQQKLDALNEGQKKKWDTAPRKSRFLEEFTIVGIIETDHIRFGDKWIEEYIERGVIYAEDEEA